MSTFTHMIFFHRSTSLHSVAQIDLSGHDREYIRQRTEIDRLNRKIAAICEFSKIIYYIKSIEGEESATYLESLSSFQDSLCGQVVMCKSSVRQLETSLRSIQMDRNKQSMLFMIGNKSAPSAASTKKIVYRIGDTLRKNGYTNVQVIPFARVPVVKCRDEIKNLDIDLVINKRIAIHNSDLIKHYIRADESGKVKKVAHLVKALAKAHNIGEASLGFISSYSWVVLLLHTLLLHEYLPAFQTGGALNSKEESADIFCESFYVGFSVPIPLPPFYRDRLASTSVEELLTLFTGYLSSRVNVLDDCLTMRGQGEVHKKNLWYKDCIVGKSQPWSLSVEVRGR